MDLNSFLKLMKYWSFTSLLKEYLGKLVTLFSPRLILGVSGEVPPSADIERVRIISEMVNDFNRKLGVFKTRN